MFAHQKENTEKDESNFSQSYSNYSAYFMQMQYGKMKTRNLIVTAESTPYSSLNVLYDGSVA